MIGVGIVGSNYGRTVLIPAFRHDPRCSMSREREPAQSWLLRECRSDPAITAAYSRTVTFKLGFAGVRAFA
jgi:hypothetical protein